MVSALSATSGLRKRVRPSEVLNVNGFSGNTCLPAWEIMHNELRYPNAEAFDGLRFVQFAQTKSSSLPNDTMRGTTFTDASQDLPIWGLGSNVWYVARTQPQRLPLIAPSPGRWHASLIIKMALAYLIVHYDFQLEAEPKSYR